MSDTPIILMMLALHLSLVWVQFLLALSWQALLLLVIAWIVVKLDKSRTPAVRYNVWLAFILAIVLLPVWGFVVTPRFSRAAITPVAQIIHAANNVVPEPKWNESEARLEQSIPTRDGRVRSDSAPVGWLLLFVMWSAGCLLSLIHLAYSSWKMNRIVRRAEQDSSGLAGTVRTAYSREVSSPVLVGLFRPTILLPFDIRTWTTDEQRALIIRHELAHLERRDHFVHLFQSLVGAVFFFHPMVRHALHRLGVERELACDDRVLRGGATAGVYAELILEMADRAVASQEADVPGFHSKEILQERMAMITNVERRHHVWRGWVGVSAGTVAVVFLSLGWMFTLPRPSIPMRRAPGPTTTAASQVEIQIPTLPNSEVKLYNPATAHPRIVEHLQKYGVRAADHRYMLSVRNRSAQPIKAIVVSWTVTDSAGVTKTNRVISDTFNPMRSIQRVSGPEHAYLVGAGSEGLIVPYGSVLNADLLDAVARRGMSLGFGYQTREIEELDTAQHVTMGVDSIIFADGNVWGPDTSGSMKDFELMGQAIRLLQERIRELKKSGSNTDALVRNLMSSAANSQDNPWVARLVETLGFAGRDPAFREIALEKLENTPPFPSFVRGK